MLSSTLSTEIFDPANQRAGLFDGTNNDKPRARLLGLLGQWLETRIRCRALRRLARKLHEF